MAPVIMGNPDRPELGEELTNSFCRTDPRIARVFARATFLSDNRADLASGDGADARRRERARRDRPAGGGRVRARRDPGQPAGHPRRDGTLPAAQRPGGDGRRRSRPSSPRSSDDVPDRAGRRSRSRCDAGCPDARVLRPAGGQRRGPLRARTLRLPVHAAGRHDREDQRHAAGLAGLQRDDARRAAAVRRPADRRRPALPRDALRAAAADAGRDQRRRAGAGGRRRRPAAGARHLHGQDRAATASRC